MIDLARLHELADTADREAAGGNPAAALDAAEAGLALWSTEPSTEPNAEGVHRVLVRARALALARLGEPAQALPLLCALVDELPRDEEVLLELLRIEPVDEALSRYDHYRERLVAELGINPGPDLVLWHRRTLRELVASPAPAAGPAGAAGPASGEGSASEAPAGD
ncbi:BTAD domain-containing putative transcriptional regulator [Cryptosporangium phraense]|uniref:Bacterial transcriptional activator domain-containing protein n=1 Tax=Cryptosporangium phraense TaxID=2593070 RepID=A0A545AMX2_9ACTN|nr:BTAD domain-containing putative transcriptional regulator [Cryptosporangium phraense]TQS42672.1 hypothetical protein FL583_23580 [Cryptosporangium phraense]